VESCACTDSAAQFELLAILFISVLHWFYFLSGKLKISSFSIIGSSDSAFMRYNFLWTEGCQT